MSQSIEIKVPALGESVTEATLARWAKNVGDFVSADEILVELETDKITLEVVAPTTGVLKNAYANKGAVVKVGSILGIMEPSHEKPITDSAISHPAPSAAAVEASLPQAQSTTTVTPVDLDLAPSVRKLVAENSINPADISPSGRSGQITKGDVLNYLESPKKSHIPTQGEARLDHRVPMSRLRQRIAERLKEAQNTAAILTTFNEIDMTAVMALRSRYKDTFEKKYGAKLGFMSFFVKACVEALKATPSVNAQIEGLEIVHKNYYDIGVAVSAPQGLVVPIVRDADELSLADIEKTIADFGQKAKENKLTLDDMSGGTFTISNGGVFGSLLSTPILNPPQSAILGMHKIQDRPVAVDGRIEIRPMMYVALSYDHRLIDGREAVTFLVTVKEFIEQPGRFFLGV
jgi:2-oxoglutarate dehydrogenase E2 component (dihydrolipoamide succinyltransferase)